MQSRTFEMTDMLQKLQEQSVSLLELLRTNLPGKNPGRNVLLHPSPYSEALRYPLSGSAHFMGPQAFSMATGHGHFFRVGLAAKPYFPPPMFAQCEAYRMRLLFKSFGPYAHSMGEGPRMFGTGVLP
jgi:hypothetical protein